MSSRWTMPGCLCGGLRVVVGSMGWSMFMLDGSILSWLVRLLMGGAEGVPAAL